jgi:hypothetical protein
MRHHQSQTGFMEMHRLFRSLILFAQSAAHSFTRSFSRWYFVFDHRRMIFYLIAAFSGD